MRSSVLALALVSTALPVHAQWSADPNVNLAISDRTSEQVNAKLAADGLGGTWISWFDHASGNYDVYVQHVDAYGVETFPHNGLLVSAATQNSSLTDWDLLCDSTGACVVTFADARAGSDLDVYAYRIDQAGTFLWGPNGVTLSNNADFEPAPRVCELSDGNFLFVWMRSPSVGDNTIRMQKVDPAGNPLFAAEGLPITTAAGEDPGFADVVPADAGSYIVQWVRNIASFSSPRHIHARKFDGNGAPLWPALVPVFDAVAVPIAYWPIVQPDGAGGAFFCWHKSQLNVYDCHVQHLDANGVELFPHNGVPVANVANQWELEPSLAQVGNGEVVVAFNRRNSGQSQWGVGVQKLDASGAPLWGAAGVDLAPFDGINESFERCVHDGQGGAIVLWFEQPNAIPGTRIRAQRVDASGAVLWTSGGIEACSNLSSKDDLEVVTDLPGYVRAGWWDLRLDAGNVYAQNLFVNGALGSAAPGDAYCAGDGLDPNVTTPCPCANTGAPGRGCASSFNALGAAITASGFTALDDVQLVADGLNATGNAIFFMGDAEDPAGLVFGDGLRCATGTLVRLRTQPIAGGASTYPDSTTTVTLSQRSGVAVGSGAIRHYLVYYRNAAAAFCPPATFNATNGFRVTW
ncbi:MAG: hypothetical protein IPJ77_15615 [Planctomycetes bacterium]|nr:hypothetical protein [Planctomycetota bacterium]